MVVFALFGCLRGERRGRLDKPIAGPGDTRPRLATIARELGRSADAAALLGRLREASAQPGGVD